MVLHPSEANVLVALNDCRPNSMTMSEIAKQADWSVAAIRIAVRACEAAGLVQRVAYRHQYRRGRLAATWKLTTSGRRTAQRIRSDLTGMWERGEIVKEKGAA